MRCSARCSYKRVDERQLFSLTDVVFKELKRDESASKSTATTIASTVWMFECIVSRLCFQWRVVNVDVKIDYKAVHVTFSLFS